MFTDKQDLYSNKALSADIQASDILNTAFYEQSLTVVQNLQPHHVYRAGLTGSLQTHNTHFWMLMEL